jgi:alpha-1,2-mannosyltransferase
VGLASVASLAGVVALVIRELTEVRGADLIWLTLAVTALTLPFGPVRETFAFGQINIFLMILVVVDVCLGRGRWWHGSLIGVAAAIKLTPAVFFLYLLLRKDVRGILVGGASFLLAHVFGFLLAWDDSIVYWTKALRDPSRIGGLAYASNQSVNGFLHRLGLDEGATQILWMVLVAVIVAATSVLMVRLIRVGHDLAAVVVVAFAGLLASPVSWAHHWVWAVPAVLVLALWAIVERPRLGGRGSDALGVTALVGCAIFLSTPYWWFPNEQNRELDWSWYMHVVGNLYLWWALAFGAALWWGTTRLKRGGKTTATASPDSPPPIAA